MKRKAVHRLLPALLLLAIPVALFAQKPLGDPFQVNPPRQTFGALPHVAANPSGEFVVTWLGYTEETQLFSLYARRFAADGRPATGAIRVTDAQAFVSYDARYEIGVAMMVDGSFVVVFPKGSDSDSLSLMARRYGPDGVRQAEVVVVPKAQDVFVSIAALGDGGVAVAWRYPPDPSHPASSATLWVRSFGPDLTPRGPAFKADQQANLHGVAASPGDPSGRFALVWEVYDPTSQSLSIVAQTFAADGSPGKRIRVAEPSYNDNSVVYAGMDGDGNFLVVWAENADDRDEPVFARRFRADGTPIGGVIHLDLGENSFFPTSLAMGRQGNFVLTWERVGLNGAPIIVRRFAADGIPLGPPIRVDQNPAYRVGEQVAIGSEGGFVVVWTGENGKEQIFARRFQRR